MQVEVDSAAIAANLRALRSIVGVPVCGVVKANGYGHGALRSAQAMLDGGAAMLGVVDLAEALALRDAGIDAPLLAWLHGRGADFSLAAQRDIAVAVSSMAQLEAAAAAGARIHLKFDTGLGRNGIARGDRAAALARAQELAADGAQIVGVMSHLAGTDRESDLAQLADFTATLAAAAALPIEHWHLANSQGALALPEARGTLVRLGMAVYGIDPNGPGDGSGSGAAALGLTPAMRVTVAVVGGAAQAGLDDGLLPAVGAPVLVDGELARVVAVGAKHLQIEPPLSGEAVLWGASPAEPRADAWAVAAGTIGYEVVTRMGGVSPHPKASVSETVAPRRVLRLGLDGAPRSLVGEVVGLKRVAAGLGLSYGAEYVTERETTLALVALGYADGVTRTATGRPMALRGHEHPIRGRVAMDQCILDIGEAPGALGDEVTIAHASAPELTGMLGPRVAVELEGEVPDTDAMEALGEQLGRALGAGDAVLLIGPLGAGKTTLTRGIGRALGARGTVQSPTFVLARTHRTAAGPDLQHVDAYRLLSDAHDEAALDDLDLDLDHAITVAEWGAPLEHALESWLRVEIARPAAEGDDDEDAPRTVRVSGHGPAWSPTRMRELAVCADGATHEAEREDTP